MNKEPVLEAIRRRRVYLDGAAGTYLMKMGLPAGARPESWNLENPGAVTEMHRAYLDAGCSVLTLNTFGANPLRRETWREEIRAAAECARAALGGRDAWLALDIGPCGRMLEPFGDLPFEEAAAAFRAVAEYGASLGVDLVIAETFTDLAETKAAVLGVREACALPLFVTNAYGAGGRLMTGADPLTAIAVLEGLGADVIGMNCSFGPDRMLPLMETYRTYASVPILVSPNAGLPRIENGRAIYDMDAERFSDWAVRLARAGANLLGGCCGTEPEYIRLTVEKTRDIPLSPVTDKPFTLIASNTRAVEIGEIPLLVGERLNPTGNARIRDALRAGDLDELVEEGLRQADAGAQALDVNAGLPGLDEAAVLPELVGALQEVCSLPLQLDSADPAAMEAALRRCPGKPLINSVNGRESSMAAMLPLAKKYGGVLVALTLDENGIPADAEGRVAIAERIAARAEAMGIARKNLIVDPLTLAVSSDPESARVTLRALTLLRERGFRTCLGVSNVSFGLPRRDELNAAFFTLALGAGLSCAIMNPFSRPMTAAWHAYLVLAAKDPACARYVAFGGAPEPAAPKEKPSLFDCIAQGWSGPAAAAAEALLAETEPLSVLNDSILPALRKVGDDFAARRVYLPQLLMSAEAAIAALGPVRRAMPPADEASDRRVVLATVEGDIHDIGKNIVRTLLESHGFAVTDLGRDVPPERVLDAARATGCRLVGLSALMTTTLPAMERTVALLHRELPDCRVVVGGAVLTQEYADAMGADFYAADAMETVKIAQEFYKEQGK